MKDVNKWTRKEFDNLPSRKSDEDIGYFDAIIILPTNETHDSGFRCMDFVAVINGKPKCRLSGYSDVVHLDGIGGFGKNWVEKYGKIPDKVKPSDWNIDCLVTSGLLRIFGPKLTVDPALSSFCVYSNVILEKELKKG